MAGNVVRILITTDSAQAVAGIEKVKASGMGLSSVMKLAGAGVVLGLGAATVAVVRMTSEFQASMERLHTQAGVSQDSIKGLGDQVLRLSGQVAQDPNSLADALYHIESSFASTGITGAKAMGLLRVAAEGATIGHANLVDVTNALDAAVVSGIPGVQNLSQAMGVLNATVGAGDMSMQDLANAFSTGMVATVKGFGLSIQDVGAAMATLGDNNMRGQVAANNFRQAIQAMAMPVKGGAKALAELGMQTDTLAKDMQQGGLKLALGDLVAHLQAAGISAEQQGQIITEAFGRKAGTALNILVSQYDRVQSKYAEMEKGANSFADAWTQTTHTLQFQLSAFADGAKAAGISVGEALIPALSDALGIIKMVFPLLTGVASMFQAIPAPIRDAALALGAFALASKLLGPAVGTLGDKLKGMGTSIAGWGKGVQAAEGMAGKFKAGLGGITGALGGPWGLAITAGATLLGFWANKQAQAAQKVDDFKSALEASGGAIDDNIRKMQASQFATDGTSTAARQLGINLKDLNDAALGNAGAQARVNAVLDQYSGALTTSVHGPMTAAQAKYGALKQAADLVRGSIGGTNDALNEGKSKAADYAAALGDATGKAAGLDVANQQLTAAQNDLTDALNASKNATLGLMGAEDNWYAAIQTATDAIKTNGQTLDVHTDKGRNNRKALEDLAKTGLDYVSNLQQQGASTTEVNGALANIEGQFIKTARQMGLTSGQAQALAGQLFGDANAAGEAAAKAQDMVNTLAALKSKVITLTVTAIGNGLALLNRPGSDVYTTVSSSGSSVGRAMKASGGVSGAASGGSRGSVTMVGEHGPELVELPYGSMVRSNPDTQRIMSQQAPTTHASAPTAVLEVRGEAALVDLFKRIVRVRGGNVQFVFGS